MELKGPRISIRPVTREDLPSVCKWWNDPVIMREVRAERFKPSLELVREHFRKIWQNPRPTQFHMFMICLNDKIIGEIGYTFEDTDRIKASLDIKIGETSLWSRGLGTEALRLMVQYLFEKAGTKQIIVQPGEWNKRSRHLAEKCGFTEINREEAPANDYFDGGIGINMVLDKDKYYQRDTENLNKDSGLTR
jgi:aminoglycoside 6'-N-acetyltransferase